MAVLAILQVMRASCWMYTLCALNWLFSYVGPQMWWLVKWLKAMVTFMWLLTTVCYQMNPENFSSCGRKITHCALIPPLPSISVYEVMLHNTCLTKCFIALLTKKYGFSKEWVSKCILKEHYWQNNLLHLSHLNIQIAQDAYYHIDSEDFHKFISLPLR